MPTSIRILFVAFVALGGAGYLGGVARAAYLTVKRRPNDMDEFPQRALTTISAILATNLGAVLGLSLTATGLAGASFFAPDTLTAGGGQSAFPIIAAYLYSAGLLIACAAWATVNFKEAVPIISEMTRTLVGVIVGAMALAAGVS